MSSIKVKETRASQLRAARNYSTRSSLSSQSTSEVKPKQKTKKKEKKQPVWICRICSCVIGNSASIGCDGKCEQWFHPSCVNLNEEEFSTFRNTLGSSWKCSNCTPAKSPSTLSLSSGQPSVSQFPGPLTQTLRELRMAAELNVVEEATSLQNHPSEPSPGIDLPSFKLSCIVIANHWGKSGAEVLATCEAIYKEIVLWRRNIFLLPSGASGKLFIEEMTKVVTLFTSGSSKDSLAMVLLMIMPALLLQKPSKRSKSALHVEVLKRRLEKWQEGDLESLVKEGRTIQKRMEKGKCTKDQQEKVFFRLMLQGKVGAALRWVGDNKAGLLDATSEVIDELISKHPRGKTAEEGSVLHGPTDKVEAVIFDSIDGQSIQMCAKRTEGAAGPSGLDSDGWKRILCSKQFAAKGRQLSEAIALMARRMCSTHIDPKLLQPYVACRLVPLDKKPGVRPVGIGEVLRRIIGKAVMILLQKDLSSCTAPLQVCAGLPGGVEAAVHATRKMYEDDECEALILVDADNAFNSLNRNAALNNVQITCPHLATYVINTYRNPAKLYVANSDKVILSEEGVTQGDNTAMGYYSCSTMPIIRSTALSDSSSSAQVNGTPAPSRVKQTWYADDAAGGGKLTELKIWWDKLGVQGPLFGYYPKPSKSWIIVKEQYLEEAKLMFPDLNVTSKGQRYLGSFIGTEDGKKEFMKTKVLEWCKDLRHLSDIAVREPQAAYAAFVYGLSKRWSYVCRTTPEIKAELEPLEREIRETFIPAILNRIFSCTDQLRDVFSLPPRYGGLGIPIMPNVSEQEYEFSQRATAPLTEAILNQACEYNVDMEKLHEVKTSIKVDRLAFYKQKQDELLEELSDQGKLMVQLASEKGSSSWLTALPLKDFGFTLNKQQFADALALRYNLKVKDAPRTCACGGDYSVNHALICKKGGYVSLRHNWLRDTLVKVMSAAKCRDIQTEPLLLPIDGQQLPTGTVLGDQARLDISARSFWNTLERSFFDVRVFHPLAPSNVSKSIPQMYRSHENEKKRMYGHRVLQVEKGTFTPLVFSTTGGMSEETNKAVKRLAQRMETVTHQRYSEVVGFIRKRLRFELLKTTVIALRGDRGARSRNELNMSMPIEEIDVNLEPFG